MARADLLALELMIHLGECYQQQLLAGSPAVRPHENPSADTGRGEAP
jgi:hypothetical protein